MSFPVIVHDVTGGSAFNPTALGVGSGGYSPDSQNHGRFPLGTKMITQDGRCFRFAFKSAADSAAGDLQQSMANVANHVVQAIQTAVVAGDRAIALTLGAGAILLNEYEGGYLVMGATSGLGYTFLIGPHPSNAGGTTFSVPLAPGHAAQVAATTSGTASLIHNPWYKTVVFPTTPLQLACGVSPRIITASKYGWLQTHGSCGVNTSGTTTLDGVAVPSTATAGAIMPSAAATSPQVGIVQQVGAAGAMSVVHLTIDG